MAQVKVEAVTEPVWLGEGPHWDSNEQVLYFVSIFDHTVNRYDPNSGKHTKAKLDGMPTFIIPIEGRPHHFVVGLNRKVVEIEWNGGENTAKVVKTICEVDQDNPNNRFNDAKADPRGRLFAGTMGHEYEPGKFHLKKGSLYRIEADGSARRVAENIDISNGLAWDEERNAFYYADSFEYTIRRYDYDVDTGNICTVRAWMGEDHRVADNIDISNELAWDEDRKSFCYADSFEYTIRRYDYDVETGNISNPRHVFKYKDHGLEGIVDGMTIDTDGNLWVANFDGSQILKIDPNAGKLLQKVPTPALQTTSCTWGDRNLDTLYVTSACMNRGVEQKPPAGSVFKVTGLKAKGRPNVSVRLH